jgi:hypothetical protein
MHMNKSAFLQSLLGVVMVTLVVLLVPAIAMQFSSEMAWGPGDFAAAGALLFAGGSTIVLSRLIRRPLLRLVVASSALLAVAVVWIELAVGIFH